MMEQRNQTDVFTRFTTAVSAAIGRPWVFVLALVILIVWGVTGSLLGFSDTWQLIINTGTTIITFLMVFIIQNTQNRDNLAINIKLDALMKKMNIEATGLLQAEDESDVVLERKKKDLERKKRRSRGRPKS